jgi:hypothetical protein
VVACGKQKVWQEGPDRGPCPARDADIGPFFTTNRRYAEKFGSEGWMVLSSRFGFLLPETTITNYDTTFRDPTTGPIDIDQLRVSAQQAGVTASDEVEILGGGEYVDRIRQALEGYPIRVLAPYAGWGGIGVMMALAKEAIEAGIPMNRLPEGSP